MTGTLQDDNFREIAALKSANEVNACVLALKKAKVTNQVTSQVRTQPLIQSDIDGG